MTKKLQIIWLAAIIVIIASQWLLIIFTYAGKLPSNISYLMATVYNLDAGKVVNDSEPYNISLKNYLGHKKFLEQSINSGEIKTEDINEVAWQRALKDQWLRNFAAEYNLAVTDDEINQYMSMAISQEGEKTAKDFNKFTTENYQMSWKRFKHLFVEPYLLETKVYGYLLDNYNDEDGIRAAQNAYEKLEGGGDFIEVAKEYGTDQTYIDSSLWLKENELINIYEPIAGLAEGDYSRIVTTLGGYIIWKVQSITEGDEGKVWEVKSLFIQAKSLEEFFQDYLKTVTISRKI